MIELERESTILVRFVLDFQYGGAGDIQDQLVALTEDPDTRPDPEDWEEARLIAPDDESLGRGVDDLAILIGPPNGERAAELAHDGPNDYQAWAAVGTAQEWQVERVGTVTIL